MWDRASLKMIPVPHFFERVANFVCWADGWEKGQQWGPLSGGVCWKQNELPFTS